MCSRGCTPPKVHGPQLRAREAFGRCPGGTHPRTAGGSTAKAGEKALEGGVGGSCQRRGASLVPSPLRLPRFDYASAQIRLMSPSRARQGLGPSRCGALEWLLRSRVCCESPEQAGLPPPPRVWSPPAPPASLPPAGAAWARAGRRDWDVAQGAGPFNWGDNKSRPHLGPSPCGPLTPLKSLPSVRCGGAHNRVQQGRPWWRLDVLSAERTLSCRPAEALPGAGAVGRFYKTLRTTSVRVHKPRTRVSMPHASPRSPPSESNSVSVWPVSS